MAYQQKSYVEHVAIRVKDINWHIKFFREVLGMEMREFHGSEDNPTQYWTLGGMQFISSPSFQAEPSYLEGWLGHLGIMVQDLDTAIAEAKKYGAVELPQANWLQLPDGLAIELMQAYPASAVNDALKVNARMK
jgi:catechol 2,3-dioxygenase-like lactoylglutathione lyase family enzyme